MHYIVTEWQYNSDQTNECTCHPFTRIDFYWSRDFFILNYSADENACFAFSINPLPIMQV